MALFGRIKISLNENALIVINDTGTWSKKEEKTNLYGLCSMGTVHIKKIQESYGDAYVSEDEFAHQLDERRFVSYLKVAYPDLEQIYLHSLRTIRHGLTILQKYKKLPLWS